VKERILEDKAVEAWSLFQADPASLDRVAAFIRKASAVFPRNTRMRFFSGCLYEHQGRTNDAIAEFERVLAEDPRHADAQRELRRLRGSLSPTSVGDRIKRLFGKD
jgi:cytochrome c-type biogenesis protein CcmH/NrfG